MLPKILKNFSAFVDGRGYAGRVDEITLPKLSIKTEEYRGGGMDVPIDIDLGMEKLEAEITFSEYDPELFRLFGIMDNSTVNYTLRGGLQGTGDAEPVVINLRGKIKELDSGSWKAGDKATLKCMIAIFYYTLTIDRRELIEIDAENMIRKINGVDQLSSMRQALGV